MSKQLEIHEKIRNTYCKVFKSKDINKVLMDWSSFDIVIANRYEDDYGVYF